MMNLIKISLYIILTLFYRELIAQDNNNIIFSINNEIYTSIDLEERKNFLMIKEDKFISDNNGIKIDFISVLLFDYFNRDKKLITTIEDKINEQYILLKSKYENLDKENEFKIIYDSLTQEYIKENIKYDIQRRLIIENELNNKKSIIFENNLNEINNIYQIDISMVTINKHNNLKIKDHHINEYKNDADLKKLIITFDKNGIDYLYKNKFLNFTENINENIKNAIIKNKNYFIIDKKNTITYGKIKKKIKNEDNINFSFNQIISKIKIDKKELKCGNFNKETFPKQVKILSNDNIKYKNLNDIIKDNLIQVNDIIEINNNNNNEYIYIILCKINFEKEFFENINTNIKINYIAKKIERDFILNQKFKYNFKDYE